MKSFSVPQIRPASVVVVEEYVLVYFLVVEAWQVKALVCVKNGGRGHLTARLLAPVKQLNRDAQSGVVLVVSNKAGVGNNLTWKWVLEHTAGKPLVVGQITKGAFTDDTAVTDCATIVTVHGCNWVSVNGGLLEVGHVSVELLSCAVCDVYEKGFILRIESWPIQKDVKHCEWALIRVAKVKDII